MTTPRTQAVKPSVSEMRDALCRSGYLLESRVAALLQQHHMDVSTSTAYLDPDTGKSRELDIEAHGLFRDIDDPATDAAIWAKLLIECVNPPAPVVFFSAKPDSEWDSGYERVKVVGTPRQQPDDNLRYNWYWLLQEIRAIECHHYFAPGPVSTQYCSFERKKGGDSDKWYANHRDQDYAALRALAIATDYKACDQLEHMDEAFWAMQLVFLFPIIVIQGDIYSARPRGRSVSLKRTDHVRLHWSRTVGRVYHRYQFDVVTERHLANYIALLERTLDGLAVRIKERMPALWMDACARGEEFRSGRPRESIAPVPADLYERARLEREAERAQWD